MTERIPWITCYLTDILISYVRDHASANRAKIDYPALFRDARVIETPANPEAYFRRERRSLSRCQSVFRAGAKKAPVLV
jgi:hypothetical protein